jgi:uncharacterized membrane protein
MFEVLLGLVAVLAIPAAAITGVVMAAGARNRLNLIEPRLRGLEQQLDDLMRRPQAGVAATAQTPAAPQTFEPPAPSTHVPEAPPVPEPITAPPVEPPAAPAPPPPIEPVAPEPAIAASSPIAPPPASGPMQPAMGLEERFGTQWVVWVGGIAIAFGGFFLLRYSIEQGWFGPGTRVFLGALVALALIAVGEWGRRKENLSGITGIASAHIPSVLTAAGTTIAFADIYAAYALYGFIGSPAAFVLLGLVALATLAAALLHGPALAGLGLVGAYVTPLLVSTNRPDFWSLYIYLAVVTAAAFALARMRLWRWLAITAVVFGLFWTLPGIGNGQFGVLMLGAHLFHVVVGFALAAALIVSGLLYGPEPAPGRVDAVSSGALAAYLLGALLLVLASRHDTLALVVFVVLVAATLAIAWRAEAATYAVPIAAVLVAMMFLQYAVNIGIERLVLPSGPTAGAVPEPDRVFFGTHIVLGLALAALFGGAGFLAQGRSEQPAVSMPWCASAVFTPLAILVALYYRIAAFDRSVPFAALALLLAALFALATEALIRRPPRPGVAAASAIFATGAIAALALAFTMALDKGWLTVALALMVPGIAWVAEQRPLPALRVLCGVIVGVVLARIAWNPRIVGRDVGTTPVFNWILYGYGIPAASFWLGGYLLRRRADDAPARLVDAAAILFTVLLAILEIRHLMNHGEIFQNSIGLAETSLQVAVGLAMTIGLERLRLRTHSIVHDIGALIIAALTLAGVVLGLALADNPMFTDEPVGGSFINLILLGYLIPAVLAAALGLIARGHRPPAYSQIAAVVAVALAIGYLSLEVRTLFHGAVLNLGPTTNAEQYTYSAVWLAFGVALLAVGIFLKSQAVRFASAAVVVLTVFKVFLVDMRDLTGIYQALSFLGLGVVLLGIGWFYQRLLFPRRVPGAPSAI